MTQLNVIPQISFLTEFHTTFTIVRFLHVVRRAVSHYFTLNGERLSANVAGERLNARVSSLVMSQPLPASKVFAAVRALVRLVIRVHAIVNVNGI